jgi:hypothetical protein
LFAPLDIRDKRLSRHYPVKQREPQLERELAGISVWALRDLDHDRRLRIRALSLTACQITRLLQRAEIVFKAVTWIAPGLGHASK